VKPKGQVLKGSWGWAWQDHRLGEDVEGGSPAVLRVSAGEGDAAHWVMAAKKKPVRRRVGKESHTQISGLVLMWGSPVVGAQTYFLWLSVSVMPWAETLKWTTAGVGRGLQLRAAELALATACGPVSDSVSTEVR
jgi:hypothetical protein